MSASTTSPGPQAPPDVFETRAAEQRRRLHNAVTELRDTVAERTDINRLARTYVWPALGIAAGVGLLMGYGAGGMFVR